ncbi:MAG: N-acetylglucosamine-6-phosphate deacetylase [Kiritimatiellae bacterium]|nr:N-acetylglucosamine-6-phosphate deacetylase [Kiritimatiellia bacterium]
MTHKDSVERCMMIRGARVVTPGRDLGVANVRVEGGRIAAVGADVRPAAGDEVIDAGGLTLLPGFVDIHSHGRGGRDFCDATDMAFDVIGRGKVTDGVTSFLATGLTRPEEELAELCLCAERYKGRDEGATCLGVHLEGPFFNAEMAGAQNPAYLKRPDAAFVKRLNAISPVRKVSLAPELDGAEECIRELAAAGIVTSGGHSAADYDTFERARAAGMTHLTHFCNAMMPIHHLRPTMVTGGLLADDVFVEAIIDGVHLSDPMIRLIAKSKGPDRVMVITDAMCAAGEPDGMYSLGGLRVKVEKGRATLADVPYDPKAVVSNVAGSVALYPDCFRRWARLCGFPLHEAIKAAGYNQLRSLGVVDRGEIAVGQVADLLLVDDSLAPRMTIVGGRGK